MNMIKLGYDDNLGLPRDFAFFSGFTKPNLHELEQFKQQMLIAQEFFNKRTSLSVYKFVGPNVL